MTISEALTKAVLLPYQKNWLSDISVVKVWEKSRRIGASYVEALSCVMKAMLSKGDGGMNCYYLSYSKEMTVQFINDAAFWAHVLGIACSAMEEVVIADEDKDVLVYKIRFDSGFEIWGLPSVARSAPLKAGARYHRRGGVRRRPCGITKSGNGVADVGRLRFDFEHS